MASTTEAAGRAGAAAGPRPSLGSEDLKKPSNYRPSSFGWHGVSCAYDAKKPAGGLLGGGSEPGAAKKGMGKKKATSADGQRVQVLHEIDGYVEKGEMLAIIGPSGGGKTCLLDILAGRKNVGHTSGVRLVDGVEVPVAAPTAADSLTSSFVGGGGPHAGAPQQRDLDKWMSYVGQEDVFHPTSTVKEVVLFHAHLRLDRRVPAREKEDRVLELIEDVGLDGKEDQRVGGPLPGGLSVRGLSGGEKRRLSLCCGLVTDPSLLLIDEPTSGLDGYAALVVMRLLKAFTQRGLMVITTIHQPRSAIWGLFQKVCVLSSGHLLYFGEASQAVDYFSTALGYPLNPQASAPDYILDLINIDFAASKLAQEQEMELELQRAREAGEEEPQVQLTISSARKPTSYHFAEEEAAQGRGQGKGGMRNLQDVIDAAARFRDSQVYATSIAGHINPTPGPLALTATEPTAASSQDNSQPAPQSPSSPTSSNASAASSTITAPTAGGATAAAITGKISGSKTGAIYDGLAQWVWQFRVLLGRTAHNYVRNPGNVLVRIAVMALLALLQGIVYYGFAEHSENQITDGGGQFAQARVMAASLFFSIYVTSILPFLSMSLMIYDRTFYSREAASRLYPCSAYYLSNITLETALHTVDGVLYASITYFMLHYRAFSNPANPTAHFLIYTGVIIIQSIMGSMLVQASALLTPNQDMAFALAGGYQAIAVLSCGIILPFRQIWHEASWIKWVSYLRFPFQALYQNAIRGTESEPLLGFAEFDQPATIAKNVGVSFIFYSIFFALGFVGLAYFHKERR